VQGPYPYCVDPIENCRDRKVHMQHMSRLSWPGYKLDLVKDRVRVRRKYKSMEDIYFYKNLEVFLMSRSSERMTHVCENQRGIQWSSITWDRIQHVMEWNLSRASLVFRKQFVSLYERLLGRPRQFSPGT